MDKIKSGLFFGRTPAESPNSESTEKSHHDQELIVEINQKLWTYFGSIILLLGIVGNCLCLCVLCRQRMRKLIIGYYLITLTTSDLVGTMTSVLRMWMYFFFGVDYFAASAPLCKPLIFLQNFSKLCSSWMVVTITVERTFLICRPLLSVAKRPCFLTPGAILILVSLLLALVVSPELYYVEVEDNVCTAAKTYFNRNLTWEFLEALHYIFYSFLPSLIIIPCSLIIVFKLRYNQWGYLARGEQTSWPPSREPSLPTISLVSVSLPPSFLARISAFSSTTSLPRATTEDTIIPSTPLPILNQLLNELPPRTSSFPLRPSAFVPNSRATFSRHRLCRIRHNIRIVLIINVIFLVTTTPLCVLRFIILFADNIGQSSKYVLFYASQIAALFSDMNIVIDLILFIASGKAFRNELKTLEPRRFRKKQHFPSNIIVCEINSN